MGKWAGLLVLAIVVLAVIGFLVDAARWIAGALLVLVLIALAGQFAWKRARKD